MTYSGAVLDSFEGGRLSTIYVVIRYVSSDGYTPQPPRLQIHQSNAPMSLKTRVEANGRGLAPIDL